MITIVNPSIIFYAVVTFSFVLIIVRIVCFIFMLIECLKSK